MNEIFYGRLKSFGHFSRTKTSTTMAMTIVPEQGPSTGFKRSRRFFEGTPHSKRPINKSLIAISKDAVDGTDVTTVLFTTTFPCTIVGLRWDIAFAQDGGSAEARYHWAIVVVRDGVTVDTLTISDAGAFFAPEENCLVFGAGTIDNNNICQIRNGSTKTMRKMQGGDTLVFICKGAATNTVGVRGVVQFFCKT